ncbi:MAG TPA: hypothetical protein VF103_16175 [Polyangiaceae bacterium]
MSQQGPGGYGPPAPKPQGTNPLVWIGVGCGVLLFLGFGLVVASVVWFRMSRGVSASGAFSAGVEVTLDGGVLSVDAGATAGTGDPTCEKAVECCRRVMGKGGATRFFVEKCEPLRNGSVEGCRQALETYRASAPSFGVTCP